MYTQHLADKQRMLRRRQAGDRGPAAGADMPPNMGTPAPPCLVYTLKPTVAAAGSWTWACCWRCWRRRPRASWRRARRPRTSCSPGARAAAACRGRPPRSSSPRCTRAPGLTAAPHLREHAPRGCSSAGCPASLDAEPDPSMLPGLLCARRGDACTIAACSQVRHGTLTDAPRTLRMLLCACITHAAHAERRPVCAPAAAAPPAC